MDKSNSIDDLQLVKLKLNQTPWLICCLCAAWCDTCQMYRRNFEVVQSHHPEKCFAWLDIEDHADLIEDIDIENFPTILIQHDNKILFFGTMLPDASLVDRLIISLEDRVKDNNASDIPPTIQSSFGNPNWDLRQTLSTL
ncbi:thioredoxin family protein [Undibacterium fentianense]|uniref:Thioredoxin family protein n=1 Tax=Undibacterium fentianense TaxID=2828728 RepID=A0A941E0N2_9BURK|nr:thioredoxin family protein [Undibacterium fentianense]MBR7798867.1 thioredoxin family protein [Undibacterium fentianense]